MGHAAIIGEPQWRRVVWTDEASIRRLYSKDGGHGFYLATFKTENISLQNIESH